MTDVVKKIWVEKDKHTVSVVCFGTPMDHLVLSPIRAHEIGNQLIKAASEALMSEKEPLVDED